MTQDLILQQVENYVKNRLSNESSGHDYWHVVRVVNNAKKLLQKEKADELKVLLAAWLHDIGDYKIHGGVDKTEELVLPLLRSLGFEEGFSREILKIISETGYRGGHNIFPHSIEAQIVQDADRLDAIGAIGIARAFAAGAVKGSEIFNPKDKPQEYADFEAYKNSKSSTIVHFYEKLLKLKDLMNTSTAKKMAETRHNFMLKFLEEFYEEVN